MTYSPLPRRIETERLLLTPHEPADAAWSVELLNEREGGAYTIADAIDRIDRMTDTLNQTEIGALVLRRKPDGEPLGYVAIVVGRSTIDEPEIAYELLPRYHGQGFATEAAQALLDAAFTTGRSRIWATIRSINAPSLRVAEKLGFVHDHTTNEGDHLIVWMVHDR